MAPLFGLPFARGTAPEPRPPGALMQRALLRGGRQGHRSALPLQPLLPGERRSALLPQTPTCSQGPFATAFSSYAYLIYTADASVYDVKAFFARHVEKRIVRTAAGKAV